MLAPASRSEGERRHAPTLRDVEAGHLALGPHRHRVAHRFGERAMAVTSSSLDWGYPASASQIIQVGYIRL